MKNIYYAATDTNEPALVIESDGIQYRMNSAFSPEHEVKRWSMQFADDDIQKVACLFGIGTGLFAEKLLDKLSKSSKLIIFEPKREVIDFILSQREDGEVEKKIAERIESIINDSRVILCIEEEDSLKFKELLLTNVDFYLQEGMIITKHTVYDKVYGESFRRYIHELNMNRERILVNKNTMARFRDNASDNVLTNMWMMEKANLVSELTAELKRDNSATSNVSKSVLPRDIPVIIVSAGPSLDKNVDLLKKAKGHCLIMAVDTAIKYLMKRDIMPDITITVEPIKPVEHYLDPRVEEIPAIFDSESNPEIVSKHRGRIFLYNCRDYVKKLLEAVGKNVPEDIPSGGSVATAAFAILYQLEMKNIVFIGQDLAYAGEFTHAGGVQSKGINNEIGHDMVEGYYGGLVRTRSDFLGYLRWFENAISVMKDLKKDINVINATEGGAKIHGTIQMTLEEVIEKLCKDSAGNYINFDFAENLKKLPPFLNDEEYKCFNEKRQEANHQLSEMAERAARASEFCDMLGSSSEKNGEVLVAEDYCRKTRAFCEAALAYPLINNYAVSEIADEVSKLRLQGGTPDQIRKNRYKQEALAFAAIARTSKRFLELGV